MGTERAAAAAVPEATGLTLAGLIDVLDRAEDGLGPRRPRPRRAVVHRSPAMRIVADRWDPLRETSPHAAGRPVPRSGVPVRPLHSRPVPLRSVRPAPPARVPAPPAPLPAPAPRGLRAAVRAFVRRMALWGAGPDGAYLAWGGPRPTPVYRAGVGGSAGRRAADRRPVDPPVVLRELPSVPTHTSAAASPAALPRPPAPRVERWDRPGTAGRLPARVPAPRGAVASRARSPGGIRGSPGTAPARGSPPWWPDPG
jgi:hypothetical protein